MDFAKSAAISLPDETNWIIHKGLIPNCGRTNPSFTSIHNKSTRSLQSADDSLSGREISQEFGLQILVTGRRKLAH